MKSQCFAYLFTILAAAAGCSGKVESPDDCPGSSCALATPDAGADVVGAVDATRDAAAVCSASSAAGIAVAPDDLAGYPPYAVDGCVLAYVAPPIAGAPGGELRLRDLATGAETVLAPSDERPRRPTIGGAGAVIAWEATIGGARRVRVRRGTVTSTLSGAFDHAGEPRASADAVVFTAWLGADEAGDTDVYLWLASTDAVTPLATGAAQQRFADISATHVAYTDFVEDPDGRYDGTNDDLADLGLYERATSMITRRVSPGKQAFPMLMSSTTVGYLNWDWVEIHPEPKLGAYHLRAGSIAGDPASDVEIARVVSSGGAYVRPAARDGILEWVDSPPGSPSHLWRSRADAPAAVQVAGLDGKELFAPSPTAGFTVLATRAVSEVATTLAAVPR